jgi:hypothetical protein
MINPQDMATPAMCLIIPFFGAGKVQFYDFGGKRKLLRHDFLRGLIVGFTLFPSFVALVRKNSLYIQWTRYGCNVLLINIKIK